MVRPGDDAAALAEAFVGRGSPSVDALLAAHGASSGVFVTAWNPRSRPQPRALNEAAHDRLVRELTSRGARFLPHVGAGPDGAAWEERGLFVLDLPDGEALGLAAAYGQNAVVAVALGGPARLLLTEHMAADAAGPCRSGSPG